MSKIFFESKILANQKKTTISFSTKVIINQTKELIGLEFIEPKNKVMNLIEIYPKPNLVKQQKQYKINIFAGPTTLNLESNKVVKNFYQHLNKKIIIGAKLLKFNFKNLNHIKFNYLLLKEKNILAKYQIDLKISD